MVWLWDCFPEVTMESLVCLVKCLAILEFFSWSLTTYCMVRYILEQWVWLFACLLWVLCASIH